MRQKKKARKDGDEGTPSKPKVLNTLQQIDYYIKSTDVNLDWRIVTDEGVLFNEDETAMFITICFPDHNDYVHMDVMVAARCENWTVTEKIAFLTFASLQTMHENPSVRKCNAHISAHLEAGDRPKNPAKDSRDVFVQAAAERIGGRGRQLSAKVALRRAQRGGTL